MHKKKIVLVLIAFAIAISIFALQDSILACNVGWERSSGVLSLALIVYVVLAWMLLKRSFLSLDFLFIMALFIYHLGDVIVLGVTSYRPAHIQNLMLYRYGEEFSTPAVVYSLWFLSVFILATVVLIPYMPSSYQEDMIDEYHLSALSKGEKTCAQTGIVLIAISIGPSLYEFILKAKTRLAFGYAEIYNIDYRIFGISLGGFTNLLLPGLLLFLIGIRQKQRYFKASIYAVMVYYVIYMYLTGRRADGLLVVLTLIVLLNHYCPFRSKLSLLLLMWLGVASVTFIAQTRGIASGNVDLFSELCGSLFNTDSIWEYLLEAGGTIRSPILIIKCMEQYPEYRFGLTYLLAPIAAILKGLRVNIGLSEYIDFYAFLTSAAGQSVWGNATDYMGGSAIAEWYFNFGWAGLLLVPILAKAIQALTERMDWLKSKPFVEALNYYICYWVLRYTRGYFSEMFWILIYSFTVSFIVYCIFSKANTNREVGFNNGDHV